MTATKPSGQPTAQRDKPWIFRTYAGHSDAAESNRLYRTNLAKGQTGLSVAFDLPTQTGYDPDHVLARGEVGKVGVPISHLGDMRALFDQIPLAQMNTSMTINATAAWLLSLYIAVADEQGADRKLLQGTTQNDLVKEYLSRGTYVFPPRPSMQLTTDIVVFTASELPKWNPTNVCSYHLQEAGASPVQELSFALATGIALLDSIRSRPEVSPEEFPGIVGRISFFVNAGMRFVTELCKMRAFVELWDEITLGRYGVADEAMRRFRYGVQVNSLGLTEPQPENNVYRILIEMLAVTLSKKARARAVQLPAWNEALGLPRPFDQQWSLRMQQVLAYETDLLEFGDIFDGSTAVDAKVRELKEAALEELAKIDDMGGALAAVETGYMKQALVENGARRIEAIERGEQVVVGVNKFTNSEPSPLSAGDGAVVTVPDSVETEAIARLKAWRSARDAKAAEAALAELAANAREGRNVMPASIACAKAGVTTGEWAQTLREIFGEYRAPTGVDTTKLGDATGLATAKAAVEKAVERLGRPPRFLVGKPGLDGHSNGAEQIAVRARDAGMNVSYGGIRQTPEEIVSEAKEQQADIIGLSILSGSHLPLVRDVTARLRVAGMDVPVVVGGIIPPDDENALRNMGVARVYTPKDFALDGIIADVAGLAAKRG
ncbi:Ethylmalonyl-CoA mutase [Hyphomicrobiales bacterium]|nr:Ethylmalonyl-CoA mutase [Hyphomicrobiales bacterium]CAH1697367.1 Ethylmalonyl-CoA mutase [Hyphomicrobiales bacterium]CAI0345556.1 Ethylmalonyl-CoA mutase [Hyphomicrobiales bacterium]